MLTKFWEYFGVALETHNMLLKRNIKASLYNIHTLKPFNKVMIKNLYQNIS